MKQGLREAEEGVRQNSRPAQDHTAHSSGSENRNGCLQGLRRQLQLLALGEEIGQRHR